MSEADVIWASLFAAGTAVEVWALRNGREGDTLSERIRAWFRVDTRTGKVVFTVGWLYFSAWFLNHVIG